MIEEFFKKDPIEKVERELRFLVWDILSDKYGQQWITNENVICKAKWSEELERKAAKDKVVQGNSNLHEIPLAYAEFYDVKEVIKNNEELFKPVFDKWEITTGYLETIIGFRNIIKHHRDISPNQNHLLIGICGEIIDSISLWRIGSKIDLDKEVLSFTDYIVTDNKSEEDILKEASLKVKEIKDNFLSAFKSSGINIFSDVKTNEFEVIIKTEYVEVEIRTTDNPSSGSRIKDINYKKVSSRLLYTENNSVPLNLIMTNLNKNYWVVEYLLKGSIDINRLKEWSEKQAGLTPGSSTASGKSFDSVDYGFLGGKIRVCASKYINDNNEICGKLSLTNNNQEEKWNPHLNITPNDLIGFMLGNISPRTIMHLYNESLG